MGVEDAEGDDARKLAWRDGTMREGGSVSHVPFTRASRRG